MFFRLNTWELWVGIAAIVLGFVALGYVVGKTLRTRTETLLEPIGVVQGALLALVGLILAFGLTLAIGRYDGRRAAVVDDANAIGTAYLRAQTLTEPQRSSSLGLLVQYTDASLKLSHEVPTTPAFQRTVAAESAIQRPLWRLASEELDTFPRASAPRLYVDSLNEVINLQTERVAALNNRVPGTVLVLELFGAAVALGVLAVHAAMLGRGASIVVIAGVLVTLLVLVIFDLDRPTRGLITVPDGPLVALRASMNVPPAFSGPAQR